MIYLIFIFGLLMGSFLNMLIYRLPLGISLLNPKRSICPKCKNIIKWYENIPLVSYILLKTRCSNCNTKISFLYPLIEILTAVITVLLFNILGLNAQFFIVLILFYILLMLSFIDLKYKAVPDYLLILAFIFAIFIENFSLKNAFIFAGAFVMLELFVTFYIQNIKSFLLKDESLKNQRAMGDGDLPIIAIIGGMFGIKLGVLAIFVAAVIAIIPSIINSFIKKDIETAFIPFLSLGILIIYFFNTEILLLINNLSIYSN